MGIYEELGLEPYLNANEWYTTFGGSTLAQPVIDAMAEAATKSVNQFELQSAAGQAIAELTQNEAVCIASSATAGIVLSVAAFMSDLDPERAEQLPDAKGMKNEVVVQKFNRFGEDVAIQIAGAQIVEVGEKKKCTEDDLLKGLNERTCAVFTSAPATKEMVDVERTIEIAHKHGVRVIVDVAWSVPPKENLWRFTSELGADVAIVSGGKGLRGPQATGLILGKAEVIEVCQSLSSPRCRIGRPMKVGREQVAGIYAAVKHFVNGGEEQTFDMANHVASELKDLANVSVKIESDVPRVHLNWAPEALKMSRDQVKALLLEDEPRVFVRNSGRNGIRISTATLSEGQEVLVADKIRSTFSRLLG